MIGTTIYALMKEKNLTQAKLAEMAGISQSTLSAIISGTVPRPETLSALSDALNVNLAETADTHTFSNAPVRCPRCGSSAVAEWHDHASGKVRFRCGYCELDSAEQKGREKALHVFMSYHASPQQNTTADTRPLSLGELLNSSCFGEDDVRPVWFENRGLFCLPALLQCGTTEREQNCARLLWIGNFGLSSYDLDKYGSWWRCWANKPSGALCDDTPWGSDSFPRD